MSSAQDPTQATARDLDFGGLGDVEPPAAITELIRRECGEGLRPASRLCVRSRVALSLILCIGMSGALYSLSASPGATIASETWLATLVWGALTLSLLILGLARPPGRRGTRHLRMGVALTVPLLFVAYLAARGEGFLTRELMPSDLAAHTGLCGGTTLLFAGLAASGLWFVWRRTDPLTPRTSGALAGLIGGLTCALAVGLTCRAPDTWHLLASHGLVVIGLMCLGWLVGRRAFAP